MVSAEANRGSVGTPAMTAVMANEAFFFREERLRMMGASSRRRCERSRERCQSSSDVKSREDEYNGSPSVGAPTRGADGLALGHALRHALGGDSPRGRTVR